MKKVLNPLLLLCCAGLFFACSKDKDVVDEQIEEVKRPFTNYEIVPTDDPFTFNFENVSENYEKLEWRFGDDSLSSEVSPTHIYKTTGKFEVNLQATSATGATARKLLIVNIEPDSVVKLNAVKVGTDGQVRFSFDTKANVDSVLWTFDGETSSESFTPSKTYDEGSLNPFSFQMTTEKGSVLKVDKFATTEGIVSNVTNKVSLAVSADNSGGQNANEGSLKIIDNNTETKLYMGWPGSFWANFTFPAPTKIKFYGIGSANDSPSRDPKDWTLQGSNDGQNWEVLDTRSGITFNGVYKKMFYYSVANPKPYSIYRWNVTANNGDGGFQISDFRLFK